MAALIGYLMTLAVVLGGGYWGAALFLSPGADLAIDAPAVSPAKIRPPARPPASAPSTPARAEHKPERAKGRERTWDAAATQTPRLFLQAHDAEVWRGSAKRRGAHARGTASATGRRSAVRD
jgi:hypothetical protein